MLAPSFKTENELNLTSEEHNALHCVLELFESNLPETVRINDDFDHTTDYRAIPTAFNMGVIIGKAECGTVGCLLGYARTIASNERLFDDPDYYNIVNNEWTTRDGSALSDLFGLTISAVSLFSITASMAAQALRNYLMYGKPDWENAVKY